MSDRGTPLNFRHMNGYTSHTFRWVNKEGEAFWVTIFINLFLDQITFQN